MIGYTMQGHFETTSREPGEEHTQGMICVIPGLPEGIEDPNFCKERLKVDAVLLDAEAPPETTDGFAAFAGKMIQWNDATWKIVEADTIDDGKPEEMVFFIVRVNNA
jgi:hypothetical protein